MLFQTLRLNDRAVNGWPGTSEGVQLRTTTPPVPELEDPAANLQALIRARASTDGTPSTVWWTGDAYAQEPGSRARHLFGFVGFNVARAIEVDGGWDLLTREAAFYLDPGTREIIDTWSNPWTQREVEILHVWNDPVNQEFRVQNPWGPWHAPYTDLGRTIAFNLDIPIAAPSALPVDDWPDNSASDTYVAMELFQFFADRSELLDSAAASAHCDVSWTRMSQWLPWMGMGQRPGNMVFHCRGAKLDAWEELPAAVRERVLAQHPEYAEAPTSPSGPNETSWSYFKRMRGSSVSADPTPSTPSRSPHP